MNSILDLFESGNLDSGFHNANAIAGLLYIIKIP